MANFLQSLAKIVQGLGDLGIRIPEDKIPANLLTPEQGRMIRAVAWGDIWKQIINQGYEAYPQAYLLDLYEDNGAVFAIFTQDGKLYQSPVTIQDSNATLGPWKQVEVQFSESVGGGAPEVKPPEPMMFYLSKDGRTRSRTLIQRQSDGRVRFFSVSCTAVLNRVGQIDSSDLFKTFEVNFNARKPTDPPCLRTFYHTGQAFRTGVVDFVAADGYTLITSGLYDDSDLAKREIAAHEADPDFWGESIEYVPTAEPVLMRVADGVSIPVYNAGVFTAVSFLPEKEAAALFTVTNQEVTRMLNANQKAAFVKLFGGDEGAADQWLEANPEALNRMIESKGLIARGQTPPTTPAPATPEATVPAAQTAAPVTPTTPEASAETEPVRREIELTDDVLDEISQHILQSPGLVALSAVPDAVANLAKQLADLSTNLSAQNQRQAATNAALEKRLATIERPETEKREQWLQDLPAATRTPRRELIAFRPRKARSVEAEGDGAEAEANAQATAESTLSQMKTRNAR